MEQNTTPIYWSVFTNLFCAEQWFWWGRRKVSIRTSSNYSYLLAEHMVGIVLCGGTLVSWW